MADGVRRAWHYRGAQREFGARQAHELCMLLGDALSNQPFEVLEGKKVIEVRLRGVNKAIVAENVERTSAPGAAVIAIGDDRTDEDLFRAARRARASMSRTIARSGHCFGCWRTPARCPFCGARSSSRRWGSPAFSQRDAFLRFR